MLDNLMSSTTFFLTPSHRGAHGIVRKKLSSLMSLEDGSNKLKNTIKYEKRKYWSRGEFNENISPNIKGTVKKNNNILISVVKFL